MPSGSPSESPSVSPSAEPSASPSDVPSMSPSESPSSTPSSSPSNVPSGSPSESPTVSPSAHPSASPSDVPSHGLSLNPSSKPSSKPSSPSLNPSSSPSNNPSKSPSDGHVVWTVHKETAFLIEDLERYLTITWKKYDITDCVGAHTEIYGSRDYIKQHTEYSVEEMLAKCKSMCELNDACVAFNFRDRREHPDYPFGKSFCRFWSTITDTPNAVGDSKDCWVSSKTDYTDTTDDPDSSSALVNIYKNYTDVWARTYDGNWTETISLPSAEEVEVGSKFLLECNSTWNVTVYYNGNNNSTLIHSGEELLVIVLYADNQVLWWTEEEYNDSLCGDCNVCIEPSGFCKENDDYQDCGKCDGCLEPTGVCNDNDYTYASYALCVEQEDSVWCGGGNHEQTSCEQKGLVWCGERGYYDDNYDDNYYTSEYTYHPTSIFPSSAPISNSCKAKEDNQDWVDAACADCETGYIWWPCNNDPPTCEGTSCCNSDTFKEISKTFVQHGCTSYYGGTEYYRQPNTKYDSFTAETCNEACKDEGFEYFGFECPMTDEVHCQCYDAVTIGEKPEEEAVCKERVGNGGNKHCTGPAMKDGVSLGGADVGSIYKVKTTCQDPTSNMPTISGSIFPSSAPISNYIGLD